MKKNALKTIFAAILLAASLAGAQNALAEGKRDAKNGITVLTLEGTPYEIGYRQGVLMKDEIQKVYKSYLYNKVINQWTKEYAYLSGKGGIKAHKDPRSALLDLAKNMEPYVPAEFRKEMHGIADGAGLNYDDVLIMTSHVDYFAIMCSTFVARGAMTKNGALIQGRNLDWAQGGLKDLDPLSSVIVRKPEKGHAFASVIYPGLVGDLTAINDAGLTVELNFSMALASENGEVGLPILILVRQIAQYAGSIDEAEAIIRDATRVAGYNITVMDGKTHESRVIECTAKTVGVINLENDALITTNHFMSKELVGKNNKASSFSSSPSPERYARLQKLLATHSGAIDTDLARVIMHDAGVKVDGTVQTIITRPETFDFWVWTRNRAPGDFVPFNLKDFVTVTAMKE